VNSDADFNADNNQEGNGSDTVHYRVSVAGQNGPYSVVQNCIIKQSNPASRMACMLMLAR
jgi:hypothetical protein